jgi:hypothetical protein
VATNSTGKSSTAETGRVDAAKQAASTTSASNGNTRKDDTSVGKLYEIQIQFQRFFLIFIMYEAGEVSAFFVYVTLFVLTLFNRLNVHFMFRKVHKALLFAVNVCCSAASSTFAWTASDSADTTELGLSFTSATTSATGDSSR